MAEETARLRTPAGYSLDRSQAGGRAATTKELRSRGATQTLTDAGDVDHNQTVRKALPLVISGFTQ